MATAGFGLIQTRSVARRVAAEALDRELLGLEDSPASTLPLVTSASDLSRLGSRELSEFSWGLESSVDLNLLVGPAPNSDSDSSDSDIVPTPAFMEKLPEELMFRGQSARVPPLEGAVPGV